MKKITIFFITAALLCCSIVFAVNAQAEVNQYVSGKLSYDFNKAKVEYNNFEDNERGVERLNKNLGSTHIAYGVRAGYVRGELELNNSLNLKKTLRDGDENTHIKLYKHSLMANAYFDYLTCTPWTPYVGAGLGYAYLKENIVHKSVYNLDDKDMAIKQLELEKNKAKTNTNTNIK